jgi:hypothetical protein
MHHIITSCWNTVGVMKDAEIETAWIMAYSGQSSSYLEASLSALRWRPTATCGYTGNPQATKLTLFVSANSAASLLIQRQWVSCPASPSLKRLQPSFTHSCPLLICLGGVVPINCILDSISGTKHRAELLIAYSWPKLILLISCPDLQ